MKFAFRVCLLLISLCPGIERCAHSEQAGGLEGVVKFLGEVPKSRIADDAGTRRSLMTVDRRTNGAADVLVYLDVPAVKPDGQTRKQPIIDQFEHRFVPHLLATRTGQSVKFTNSDPANHNVRAVSFDERNTFNIFTGAGGEYEHTFYAQRKNFPIRLSCDIHPWMTAWIFVFEHPYYAVTDQTGRFSIANVPAGDYPLVVRQPDVGYLQRIDVSIESGKASKRDVEFTPAELKLLGGVGNGD